MPEPIFVQGIDSMKVGNAVELKHWVQRQHDDAKARGCQHLRTTNDNTRWRVLVEGWPSKPDDEGEPRWGERK